jgi:hypothetical protein
MKNFVSDTIVPLESIPAISELLLTLAHRVQKLNQAIVLVSSYMPDTMSMKMTIINNTFSVLNTVHQLEIQPEYATVRDITNVSISLRHVNELLEIAYRGNYVSEMNYSIIHSELASIMQFIDENIMMYCIGNVTFPFRTPTTDQRPSIDLHNFFKDNKNSEKKYQPLETKKNNSLDIPNTTIVQHKSPTMETSTQQKTSPEHQPHNIKDKEQIKTTTQSVIGLQMTAVKPVLGEDKKERRDAIMRTIRSKGQVTIKDISENISGCSEKTIQRDLQELIQHGVLMREGEKRWAVYKLAMKNV